MFTSCLHKQQFVTGGTYITYRSVPRCLDPLLHCAALHGDLDLCQRWVQAGANINMVNTDGTTPLCAAAQHNNINLGTQTDM